MKAATPFHIVTHMESPKTSVIVVTTAAASAKVTRTQQLLETKWGAMQLGVSNAIDSLGIVTIQINLM